MATARRLRERLARTQRAAAQSRGSVSAGTYLQATSKVPHKVPDKIQNEIQHKIQHKTQRKVQHYQESQ